jgi:glycosyltransferase involved in cell wall biosynthesis
LFPEHRNCDHAAVASTSRERVGEGRARIAVIIPCYDDGSLVAEAAHSVEEPAPVELVVVDDCSSDAETEQTLGALEAEGVKVIRHDENRGPAAARMTALEATSAPYVVPLDADDLAEPGALTAMADRLEASSSAAACVGDILEFGDSEILRAVPERLDPYRVAYTNEYPITAVFRRSVLEAVGGWRRASTLNIGYEDWNLWMTLAERGESIVHLGPGRVSYRRRLHGRRLNQEAKRSHVDIYRAIRSQHPDLFARIREHRRRSGLSRARRALYPVLYGERAEIPFQHRLKPLADRLGLWTLTRRT